MANIICVYKIVSPNNRVYIGSTINWKERLASYQRLDCKQQPRLYHSFIKYGVKNHSFEVIEICTIENVRQRESFHGHNLKALSRQGMNCTLPKSNDGVKNVSDQWRINMGILKKGNKNCLGKRYGPDVKERMSVAQKARTDRKPHTETTKKLMSKKATGGNNHKAIILLNINTGIYYDCFMDAANSIDMKYNTFRSRLYHKRPMPFIAA